MPLVFLAELDRASLPVAITCPRALRHVSRLKATGLIDASLAVAALTQVTKAALVWGVTEDGRAHVAPAVAASVRMPSGLNARHNPASELLRFLEFSDFPAVVEHPAGIDSARLLMRAGLIDGVLGGHSQEGAPCALVRGLTAAGKGFLLRRDEKASNLAA